MKQVFKTLVFFAVLVLLYSCSISPQPIKYGSDGCHFCEMTIVDKTHAAEVVTDKGKIYKFDATECMIHFMDEFDISKIELYLSNDYLQPEELIDARNATFLISKKIPSPMGAYLSAFKTRASAEKTMAEKGGKLYTWEELIEYFKNN